MRCLLKRIVTRINMIPVYIIPPARWWQRARYVLQEPVCIGGHCLPKGFETDGASVPRLLAVLGALLVLGAWNYSAIPLLIIGVLLMQVVVWFPPIGRYTLAAAVHDYLLTNSSRRRADREFLRVMVLLDIPPWRRWLMFIAVKIYSYLTAVWRFFSV